MLASTYEENEYEENEYEENEYDDTVTYPEWTPAKNGGLPLGVRLIPISYMTTTQTVNRTWKERLLSRPWRPWVAMKTTVAPDKSFIYDTFNRVIYAHPQTIQYLQDYVK